MRRQRIATAVIEIATDNKGLDKGVSDAQKKIAAMDFSKARAALGAFIDSHRQSFTAIGQFAGIVTAGIGAAAGAIAALGMRGGDVAGVESSFHALARSIGESGEAMLAVSRQSTKGLISDMQLMESANKAMLLGLPVTAAEMGTLGKTAVTLGKAMKIGPEQAMNDLITALGRSSPLILDNLGLTVKVGEANEAYAKKLGKSVSELTDGEKKLAFYNAAMAAAGAKTEELGEIQLTFSDRIQQAKTFFQNFTDSLGQAIATSPVIAAGMDAIGVALGGAFGGDQQALVQRLMGWVNSFAIALTHVAEAGLSGARFLLNAWHGLKIGFSAIMTVLTGALETLTKAIAVMIEQATKLPFIGDKFRGLAGGVREAATHLEGMRKSFQDQTDEAIVNAAAQNAVLDKVRSGIQNMRGAMIAARDAQVQARQPALDLSAAQRAAAGSAGDAARQTDALAAAHKKSQDETKKHTEAVQSLRDQLSGAKVLADVRLLNEAFLALTPAQRENAQVVSNVLARYAQLRSQITNPSQLPAELEDLRRKLLSITDAVKVTTGVIQDFGQKVPLSVNPVAAAFERMGITMRDDLQRTADQAVADFDLISASGQASVEQINIAFEKMRAAQRAAAEDRKLTWQDFKQKFNEVFLGNRGVVGILDLVATSAFPKFTAGLKLAKSAWSAIGRAFAGDWSGVMQLAQQHFQKLLEWVGKGVQKIAGWFKSLFGGPSAKELGGREVAGEFRNTVASMMNERQRLEAGNNEWAKSVIVVRDAYLATGRTEREALAAMDALWRAEKQGAEAVEAQIAIINGVLQQHRDLAKESARVESELTDASKARMQVLEQQLGKLEDQRKSLMDSIADEAPEDVMGVIERQARAQIDALDKQIAAQKEKMQAEAEDAVSALEEALGRLKPKTVEIPFTWVPTSFPGASGFSMPTIPQIPTVPMADGGFGRVTRPTLFYSGGAEDFAFSGEGRRFGGESSGSSAVRAQVILDGREVGFAILPELTHCLKALL